MAGENIFKLKRVNDSQARKHIQPDIELDQVALDFIKKHYRDDFRFLGYK